MLLINGIVVFKEVQFPWNAPRNNKPSQGPQSRGPRARGSLTQQRQRDGQQIMYGYGAS